MAKDLSGMCASGVLRAAINTGNRALVKPDGEHLGGVSPALARRLAAQLGVELQAVVYDGAGKVFADAGADIWDVAFLAIDATRAKKISFTRPYHVIEATYAVRAGSDLSQADQVDGEGTTILTSTGSAYDMHLSANLSAAKLEHSGTPSESFAEFRGGRADAVAGVRASLERFFDGDEGVRVLDGRLTAVEQAMVLPGHDNAKIEALDTFVAEAIADGFVARELGG